MAETPNVRLRLSSRPENVLLIRQALGGLAESISLDSLELNDISTAVSEACNNVVLHAYEGDEGPLEVEICGQPGELLVAVRDRGRGIQPHQQTARDGADGIGLPIIRALAESVECGRPPGGGTEVRMTFATVSGDALERPPHEDRSGLTAIADEALASTVTMAIAPTSLSRTVLPRVVSALAARAHFSTDRISEARVIAVALARGADGSVSASHLSIAIDVAPRQLGLRLGPLRPGSASTLLNESGGDGFGPAYERLLDRHAVSSIGGSEVLELRLAESR
jgi:serine/threonine-protein kinase RsbW